jgi:IS30 family transposase
MPEHTRRYARLTFDERCTIQELLGANASVSEIAQTLHRSVSTVTREVVRNRRDDGYRREPSAVLRLCAHERTCAIKGLCPGCWNKRCASCRKVRCANYCTRYRREVCAKNTSAPFCCNGCRALSGCRLHRYRYDARLAQQLTDTRRTETRAGIDTTAKAFRAMLETVRPLIKERGQSISHVWAAHPGEFPCSERTFYRYVDLGLGEMKNLDLPSKCRYRPRTRRARSHFRVPEGHTFKDFCDLPEEERLATVELDCIEGPRSDRQVLLTMLFKRISFVLVFVLEAHTQACVHGALDALQSLLEDDFPAAFPLLLADCGQEFQGRAAIERGARTRLYYCDPGRADQKGSIENCHRQIRRIVPKGHSLDGLTRRDGMRIASHVNSMPRPALGGAAPFELAHHVLPKRLLEGLGLEHIAPDEVVLKPSLLHQD